MFFTCFFIYVFQQEVYQLKIINFRVGPLIKTIKNTASQNNLRIFMSVLYIHAYFWSYNEQIKIALTERQ